MRARSPSENEVPIKSSIPYHFLAGMELAPQTRGTRVEEGVLRHEAPPVHSCPLSHQPWGFVDTPQVFRGMGRARPSDSVDGKQPPKNVVGAGVRGVRGETPC